MSKSMARAAVLAIVSTMALMAQENSTEGTRQLYYLATPSKEEVPPIPHGNSVPSSANVATAHLGLRYNVVLVEPTGKSQQISSERVLNEGDCFAIDLRANQAGYLYVLARQSSGAWTPLTDMPGQREALPAGKTVRVPSGACFSIHNPPGTETLFVVLSRDPRDFYELYESMKTKEGGNEQLSAAVAHMDEKFGGTRDITIARVGEPEEADEPRGAVYVVNKKTSASIVTKIQVRHR